VIGALGVGAYAYYDTGQVARTAIAMFEGEIVIEEIGENAPAQASRVESASLSGENHTG
jgi:hypothetical protein